MPILGWVLQFLGGNILTKAMEFLRGQQDAMTEQKRIDASVAIEHIKAEIEARRAAKEIRLATAGFWEQRLSTFLISLPFIVHVNLVGLDTNFQLGWGIPKFPAPFDEWEGTILLSFFGVQVAGTAVRAVGTWLAKKH